MKKRDGFLYVLRHPSRVFSDYGVLDSGKYLFKIGVTVRTVEIRLKQHNADFTKVAGYYVKETGLPWEVEQVCAVPDTYAAESIFWGHSPFADMPGGSFIEIGVFTSEEVQVALDAVLRLCNGSTKVSNAKKNQD